MENLITYPNELPKLADGTVLTLPLKISIAITNEPVKIWQSNRLLPILIIFIFVFLVAVIGGISWGLLVFLGLMGLQFYLEFHRTQRFQIPHKRYANQFTWQIINILTVFDNYLVWLDMADNTTNTIHYDDVKQFKIDISERSAVYTKTLKNLKNTEIYLNGRIFILNDSYIINQLEIDKLLNNIRKSRTKTISFKKIDLPFQ